jgi:hypothetical protein
MASREFVPWVQPIAILLADDHSELVDFARSLPQEVWDKPSEIEGWTYKHILAHLAGGNDQLLQVLLRKVVAREPLDPALLDVDTDAENATRIEERVGWPIGRLLGELEEAGDEVQDLLAQLNEEDRDYRGGSFPMTIGQFLQIVKKERHDMIHLAQLRPADAG